MIEALTRPRWPWIQIALGIYSSLVAVLPDTARLALVAPMALIGLAWWILAGPPDRWLLSFLCAAVLLPPLPIALGDSGPHPSLILAAMGALVGLIRLRQWRVPMTGLGRSMIVLFFALMLSLAPAALYSGLPVALGSLARVLLFGISVYVFFYVTSGPLTPHDPVRAFRWTQNLFVAGAVAALFACVDFYYQFPAPAGFGPQFVWLNTGVFRRAQGLFYEASTLGNFCAFFLVLVAITLTWPGKRPPLSRPLLLIGAAILSAALVLSFSRASLLNVLVALVALIWLRRRQLGFRRIGMGLLFAVIVGSVATHYFLPAFTELYWNRISNSAAYLFTSTEGVLSGRLSSWNILVDFLRENPFHALFGIGYKTLPYSTFLGQAVVGDNMYLTMLVETGMFGLAAFLVLNVSILRVAYRAAGKSDLRASFFGTWVFCFWIGEMAQMLSGDLFTYWRVLPFYFWALAVAARSADEHPLPRSVQ